MQESALDIGYAVANMKAETRQRFALEGYQAGSLTASQAARVAGLGLLEFRKLASSRGLLVNYDVQELEEDLSTLRRLGWW